MTNRTAARGPTALHHRVVVGVDGSDGCSKALEWAAAEANRIGAILEVNAVYAPGYEFITPDEVQQTMQDLIDEAIDRVAALAPGVAIEGMTHVGSPARTLIEASWGADLLVVGSRGLGGFTGLLLGSVSQQCSLHAHCPILIVRPTEENPTDEQS